MKEIKTEMEIDSVFGNKGEGARPLPKPTATFVSSDGIGEMTEDKIRGIVCNPVYAGIGPFPGLITDEQWVRAAADSSTDSLSNTFGRFFLCFCDKARKRTRPRKDRNLCYRLTSQTSVRNARAVSGEDLLYQPFDADRRLY